MQLRGLEEMFKPVGKEITDLISEQLDLGSVFPDKTQTKIIRKSRTFYRKELSKMMTANEGKPLSFDQKDELQDLTEEYAEGLLTKFDFKGDPITNGTGGVSLDGELIEGAGASKTDDPSTNTVPEAATNQFNLISQLENGEVKDAYLKRLNEQYGTSLTFGDTPEETPVVETPVVEATPLDNFEMSELWNHLNKKRQGTNRAERPAYISKADLEALTPEELQDVFGQDLLEIQAEKDESQAAIEGGQNFAADTLDFIKEYTPFIDNEREALERVEDELIESIYDEKLSAKERVQYKKTLKLPERFYRLNEETNAQEVYIPE
tara:strand:- start:903 stop:1868 length:966 start_codon:yes stop_codon:yes gene_type:complete